ncbi:hypothetical protein [Pectinatus haikarae]|uniref:Uncharacterized protein n=1 Tax=Pectinatus haikarae TaxID=349096 RepID=A0ABT9Y552_9FIRM|nr:hypothetical protein [Pectinatus haikarae]MDQ0202856.1 hypothetical protein [Pectinatus haikarae]
MKKYIASFITAILIILAASVASANPYNEYLNGDPNFKLCDGHMGIAWYVDLSSLNVNLYNPPEYIIGINIISANSDDNYAIQKIMTYRFKYNYDRQAMYFEKPVTGEWKYIPPDESWANTGVVQSAGEIAFRQAYGIPFYH